MIEIGLSTGMTVSIMFGQQVFGQVVVVAVGCG